jgi:uncharacterized protein (DUF433 family)
MENIAPDLQTTISLQPFTVVADPLPLRLDKGGTYRVGPTRVRLDSVVYLHNQGSSPAQIVSEFPSLELADVHAVIGYYLRHQTEVDAYLKQRECDAEELKRRLEAEGRLMSREKMAEIKRRFAERQNRQA